MNLLKNLKKQLAKEPGTRDVILTMRMTDDESDQLDKLAEHLKKSRNWVVTRLIQTAYEELKEKS